MAQTDAPIPPRAHFMAHGLSAAAPHSQRAPPPNRICRCAFLGTREAWRFRDSGRNEPLSALCGRPRSPTENPPTHQTGILESGKMGEMGGNMGGGGGGKGGNWIKMGGNGGGDGKIAVIAQGMWVVEGCGGMWFGGNGTKMGRNTHFSQCHSPHLSGGRGSSPSVPFVKTQRTAPTDGKMGIFATRRQPTAAAARTRGLELTPALHRHRSHKGHCRARRAGPTCWPSSTNWGTPGAFSGRGNCSGCVPRTGPRTARTR